MTKNMGKIDRILRAGLGIVLVALALLGGLTGSMMIGAIVVGAIMLITSTVSFCPLYRIIGVRTCKDC